MPPTLHQATANPRLCQRLLDTHRQVWVSLLWDHCSFLLGPDAHKVIFCALQVSVSPVLCKFYKFRNQIPLASKVKFSGSFQSLCQIPRLGNLLWVLEKHRSASVSVGSLGPDVHKALFEANHGAFVCVWLFTIPWTVAHQVPLSVEFSREEYWSRLPFPSPGDLPDPGIKPRSPALQADSLPSEPLEKPLAIFNMCVSKRKCPNPWG